MATRDFRSLHAAVDSHKSHHGTFIPSCKSRTSIALLDSITANTEAYIELPSWYHFLTIILTSEESDGHRKDTKRKEEYPHLIPTHQRLHRSTILICNRRACITVDHCILERLVEEVLRSWQI